MRARFRRHRFRQVEDLAGTWDFAFLGDVNLGEQRPESVHFDERMLVPACFDALPRHAGRRGVAAYRTRLRLTAGELHRLVFDGVHHTAAFWLDGRKLGSHAGGFTRFTLDVPSECSGDVDLVVFIDNRSNYANCPLHLEYYDWYHYGGITRGAELERLGQTLIEGVDCITESLEERRLRVIVRCRSQTARLDVPLRIQLGGREVHSERLDLPQGATRLEREFAVPSAEIWSPSAPRLHALDVELADDGFCDRIGIRTIAVEGSELRLNGQPLRLLGVNRHEFHPEFGHAVPPAVALADLDLLERLGVNCVRGSHYPQDTAFLDLCDERGILVWQEAIGWQNKEEHLCDEHFLGAQEQHIDEMLAMSVNHPSVVLLGLLNEGCSRSAAARPGFQRLIARIRERDPSRPVTFATLSPYDDRCLDLVDVIAVNSYPAWYFGTLDTIALELERLVTHLSKTYPARPIVVAEIGAEGLYGYRDHHRQRWSEEYQAELLGRAITHLGSDARVSGILLWQYSDCRTPEQVPNVLGRARGFNNKGIVDEYRRPKLAFDRVASAFHAVIAAGASLAR